MTPARRRQPAPPPAPPRHVALVGMMGSGKSTVGHSLARRLDRRFVDTDTELVRIVGLSIPEMFEQHGEPWFRAKETEILSDCLSAEEPVVLSVGGGTVVAEHNRALLRAWSDVVWLRASLETLVRRVGSGVGRPVLADDPEGVLRRLLDDRRPLYTEVAAVTVDVDGHTTRTVTGLVARALNEHARRTR